MIDFTKWKTYDGMSEGSGRSDKIWLTNEETGQIGLFKFPKSLQTTEHISEKLASEIAEMIELKCSKIDLGIYNNRIGSMSYKINTEDEILIEGIQLISTKNPNYDQNSLYDSYTKEYYSLAMILNSIEGYNLDHRQFLNMMLFDFLIGNTDRHQNNWAILRKNSNLRVSPLYDNGSALCCYVKEEDIDSYLGKDKMRFKSLVDSKSKSRIRINKYEKKEPTHLEVIEYIHDNYYNDVIEMVNKIILNINETKIKDKMAQYSSSIISDKRKELIIRFIIEKLKIMNQVFN